MISINNLNFSYPDNVFSFAVNKLNIESGNTVAVKGPSGSGKSTFLKLLSGQIQAQKGDVIIGETNLSNLSESASREFRLMNFGIISQTPNLIEWMSIIDNVFLPAAFSKAKENSIERYNELLHKFSLSKLENKAVGKLSLGEQFRVSIIRALLNKPQYVLADEPTASFDAKLRDEATDFLVNECLSYGATLIIVSHEEEVLERFSKTLNSETWEIES